MHVSVLFCVRLRQKDSTYIANYCYELTKVFNQFYHDYSILNESDEQKKLIRLMLAKNVAKIIKNGMGLLGIEVPERSRM